jgi:hypothetical protein
MIVLHDALSSNCHCRIRFKDGQFWLFDQGSKFGTGVRISVPKQKGVYQLGPGMRFGTMHTRFVVDAIGDSRDGTQGASVMATSRSRRSSATTANEQETQASFTKLWPRLLEKGWSYKAGGGLVSWYYLRPGAAGIKDGKEGKH